MQMSCGDYRHPSDWHEKRETLTVKVMLAGSWRYHWYAPAWCRALIEANVIAEPFDVDDYLPQGLPGRAWRFLDTGPFAARLNEALVHAVVSRKPDVVMTYNVMSMQKRSLNQIREKAVLVGYTNDDPFGAHSWRPMWRRLRATIPCYDAWHVFREENISEFTAAGARHVRLLMPYYLPWEVTDDCLRPRDRFDYDVTFVGHGEPDGRARYIEALIDAGVRVIIFGNPDRWHRCLSRQNLGRLPPIREVSHGEYRSIVRRSRISLAFLSGQNRDQYTRRCFEIPSWGGFMVAPRTPSLESLYQDTKEACFYESPEDLVLKATRFLADSERRESIAQAGQVRCLKDGHDVVSRARQWLRDIEGS